MWAFVVSLVLVVALAMLVGNVFSQPLIMDKDISSEDSLIGTNQTFLPDDQNNVIHLGVAEEQGHQSRIIWPPAIPPPFCSVL